MSFRRIIQSFLSAALIVLVLQQAILPVYAASTARLYLDPATASIQSTASFAVQIRLSKNDSTNVDYVRAIVTFPADKLNVTSISLQGSSFPNTIGLGGAVYNNTNGTLSYEARSSSSVGSGDFLVATIHFTAKNKGTASVAFTSQSRLSGGGSGSNRLSSTAGATYTVTSAPAPAPTPSPSPAPAPAPVSSPAASLPTAPPSAASPIIKSPANTVPLAPAASTSSSPSSDASPFPSPLNAAQPADGTNAVEAAGNSRPHKPLLKTAFFLAGLSLAAVVILVIAARRQLAAAKMRRHHFPKTSVPTHASAKKVPSPAEASAILGTVAHTYHKPAVEPLAAPALPSHATVVRPSVVHPVSSPAVDEPGAPFAALPAIQPISPSEHGKVLQKPAATPFEPSASNHWPWTNANEVLPQTSNLRTDDTDYKNEPDMFELGQERLKREEEYLNKKHPRV